MNRLRDFLYDELREERRRRQGDDREPIIMMRVLVEPVLSPDGNRTVGKRHLDTGASAVIAGRGRDRIRQRDDETIEAFEARVEAATV
jgi:hypothetical protein